MTHLLRRTAPSHVRAPFLKLPPPISAAVHRTLAFPIFAHKTPEPPHTHPARFAGEGPTGFASWQIALGADN